MADKLDDARRIVAKVQAETRAEREAEARRVLAWLDDADPGVRVRFMAYTIQRQRDDAAALRAALDGER